MKRVLSLLLVVSSTWATEYTAKDLVEMALQNNREIRASQREVEASRLELRAARGAYFPRLKLEETYTRTDLPVYAFMMRLQQERLGPQDLANINNPPTTSNFETKFTLEIPIWLGGKVQAGVSLAEKNYKASLLESERLRQDVVLKTYEAYIDASVAKESIKVAQQAVKDAKEHVRLAKQMNQVGVALFSDVLRAQVYLSSALQKEEEAKNAYKVAKKGIELVVGKPLGEFDVKGVEGCPTVQIEDLKKEALVRRKDLKALEERINMMRSMYYYVLSDNLPQIYAFGSYILSSKDRPFGSGGSGYLIGVGLSWTFDTGLTTFHKAQSQLERERSLREKLKLMQEKVLFDLDKNYADYVNALNAYTSAQDRVKASEEVVRVMETRYRNGLARMVDLLDAQTELDKARFDLVKATGECNKAYVRLLHTAGVLGEVLP
ncbi:outer membrane efflux protein [Thermocrinis albus DSM 14484]|uniref:Outer membrane efflux protein n=1 Tax=Thermocrinis albus (strain DSM 14484 / JCM 11386 / HI 11/12) TaxID=638303 RepID=D3SL04_THEAH|nr:TolC family protein [Thermocrinis albus]ADC89434.1 outer membrane efflux protein [Thermocrinis albus DSM 14484]